MLDSFKREDAVAERKRLHCIECKRPTIHNLEARCTGHWADIYVDGGHSYSIYRCGACDNVCYQTASWHSEDTEYDEETGSAYAVQTIFQYPPPVSSHFTFNTESTPSRLNAILDEMLYSLAGNKMILATVGLRLAIEFIVKDKKCVGKSLEKKIDDLRSQEFVDDNQHKLLQRIRKRGNAGAHEAVGMTPDELIAGMSIVEGLLEKLYNGPARHEATIKRAMLLLAETSDGPSASPVI